MISILFDEEKKIYSIGKKNGKNIYNCDSENDEETDLKETNLKDIILHGKKHKI